MEKKQLLCIYTRKLVPILFYLSIIFLPIFPKFTTILLIAFSLGTIFSFKTRKRLVLNSTTLSYFSLICYYFLFLVSFLYSSNVIQLGKQLETKASLLFIPLIFLLFKPDLKKQYVYYAQIFSSFIGVILCMLNFLYKIEFNFSQLNKVFEYSHGYHHYTEILGLQSNYLSIYLLLSLAISIILLFQSTTRTEKIVFLFISILFLLNLIILSSRISLISLLIIIPLLIQSHFKFHLYKVAILVFVGMLLFVGIIYSSPNLKDRFTNDIALDFGKERYVAYKGKVAPGNSRLVRWKVIFKEAMKKPFFGHGAGNASHAVMDAYRKNKLTYAIEKNYNSHNEFLGTFVKFGIVGLFIFISIFATQTKLALKKNDYVFISFLVSFALFSLVENTLGRQHGVIFLALFSSAFINTNSYK